MNPKALHTPDEEKEINRYNRNFQRYRVARKIWEERGYENEALARNDVDGTGTQLTKEQIEKLKRKYGIPVSLNIAWAIKDQLISILTAAKPSFNVIPNGEASKDFAYVHRELLFATYQINKVYKELERSLGHMCDVGHGVLRVRPNRFFKRNSFNTVVECIRWAYVYFDPSAEDPLFSDSEMIFVAVPIQKSKAKLEYELTEEEMEKATTILGESTSNNFNPIVDANQYIGVESEEQYIWVMEIYEKVMADVYTLADGSQTLEKPTENGVYNNINNNILNNKEVIETNKDVFIKYSLKIGNFIKFEEIMPIREYPVVPVVYGHTDSPMSLSLMHLTKDIYKAANKFLSITIENAQKGSNVGSYAFEGSIIDSDEFEKTGSEPGAVTLIEPNPALPNGGMPVQKQVQPLSSAWFGLLKEMIKYAEYITGMLDLVQGHTDNAPETKGATMELMNFGTQRVKKLARGVDGTMERLSDIIIQFMQAYAPRNNIMTYMKGTDTMMKIRTDVEGALQQSQQGLQFQEVQNGQQMATIVEDMTNQKVEAIFGTPKVGEFRVSYVSSTNLPTARATAQSIITTAMSRMANDSTAVALMKAALNMLDLPEVDLALKEADLTEQQQMQIQQLQKQMEEIALSAKEYENKYYDQVEATKLAEIGAKVDKAQSKVDVEMAKLKEAVKDTNAETKKRQLAFEK